MADANNGPPPPVPPDRLIHQVSSLVQPVLDRLNALLNSNDFNDGAAIHDLIVTCRDAFQASLNCENLLERFNTAVSDNERLTQEINELNNQVNDLTASNDANLDSILELTAERNNLRTIALNLSTHSGKSTVSDPEKFSGDKSKYRTFITQLRLRVADIPDEQRKLRHAVNLLTGDAATHAYKYVKDDRVDLPSFASLTAILDRTFGDSNRKIIAEEALYNLKQGSRSFADLLTDFEKYRADVDWEDSALKYHLQRALSYQLDAGMIPYSPDSMSLDAFITKAQEVDNNLRRLKERHAYTKSLSSRVPAPRPAPAAPAPSKTAATTQSTAFGTHSGPMDTSSTMRRLSPAEKARRMKEGLCWYCGETNHMARNCPRKGSGSLRVSEAMVTPDNSAPLQIQESENE